MKKNLLLFIFILLGTIGEISAKTIHISGKVTDGKGVAMEFVNISVKGTSQGCRTDSAGRFEFEPTTEKDSITLLFSFIGFKDVERAFSTKGNDITIRQKMEETTYSLDDIVVKEYKKQSNTLQTIDLTGLKSIPSTSGSIESIITTQAGVSANNELSSQYSVRGGNYDENIVYVNDIEVYRPLLIRAGQQEGLSFVNPDLVGEVKFSSGGFSAQYGDKMASVLDIQYKKPKAFEGSVSASLLGASAYLGSSNKKFTQVHGVRYKTSSYLLGSLETEGEYDPNFFDYQTFMTYQFTKKSELTFLGNYSRNSYNFEPKSRETSFGTMTNMKSFTVYFDGQEKDLFQTLFGAMTFNYKPVDNTKLGFMLSSFNTIESETYDIAGEYRLGDVDGSNTAATDLSEGIGKYQEHARNYLNATVMNISQLGVVNLPNNEIKWGLTYQRETVKDKVNEWEMRDSAGYSIPVHQDYLALYNNLNADYTINTNRYMAYLQDTYSKRYSFGKIIVNGGVRANYWDFNKELLVSPRANIAWFPNWKKNFGLRLATGIYYQAPYFKEIRDTFVSENGNVEIKLNDKIKAQRSFQILLGSDYYFRSWDRPFKFTTEVYFKYIDRINPYTVDNVKIVYVGDNCADGYAAGLDTKIFGEFVPGVDSWISLSLMQTKENIYGDGKDYISRPTDQLYNISLFFQDYIPGYSKLKFNVKLVWIDGLPFSPPHSNRADYEFRTPDYRRVNMGVSYLLKKGKDKIMSKKILSWAKTLSFNLEFFNLLDIKNVNSYYWVTDVSNMQYAVPNYLTGRRLNFKIQADF
ncbi:MAG TPA: carboxypeptidase-like regulatory domain-containing protein [Paludibacteraceae bacterium]|nr:carboxypeptidase-like regulatory domain-containing protein [Paludibacteraceae bacterium]